MARDNIEELLAEVRETTKDWEGAMHRGREFLDAAAQEPSLARAEALLRDAARDFRAAIRLDPDRDEAYGWLARAYRLLAKSMTAVNPDEAIQALRRACAVAWEAKRQTPPPMLSVFTKQEAKTLLAWVRATRRLGPAAGEAEMDALRAEFLTSALDPDTIGSVQGGSASAR
jgi:tetratricopeptide (TPR) repeat protein